MHSVVTKGYLGNVNVLGIGSDHHHTELLVWNFNTVVDVLGNLSDEGVLGLLTTSVGENLVAEDEDVDVVALGEDVINTVEIDIEHGTVTSVEPVGVLGEDEVVELDVVGEVLGIELNVASL